jgi:hypothetical protein
MTKRKRNRGLRRFNGFWARRHEGKKKADTDLLGAACGRNQIRSTIRQNDGGQESEIIDKSESPKLKIQNKP